MKIPVPLLPRSLRWGGVVAVAALIFYGSLVTVPETVVDDTTPGVVPVHLWRHVVAYFTLACALAYATDHWDLPRWRSAVLVIGIVALYGVCIEFGQALVPHRTDFLLTDVVANTLGASGVLLWYGLRPWLAVRSIPELIDRFSSRETAR